MLCRERSSICRSSIFNSLLLPDCFSNNAKEKSGIPVEGNNNNINYFSFTEERNSSVFRNNLVICKRVHEATNVRNLHTP